ncbi:predicted protein [Naegleria gruberi]|uniref:Predicted protein n=1 Tax=Naegleria gruberi TaxID=5762 RepID=D2W5C3_NAEGR|nr:uncharacterized protein NAEGRDRAFT_76613 [Naegleria gruberi]EFC35728.1 predicted protein [Naegleria gruberi]|eukprot:XP_002668472.1 predicted protein [Naegleria gruberi strain NEG-M]
MNEDNQEVVSEDSQEVMSEEEQSIQPNPPSNNKNSDEKIGSSVFVVGVSSDDIDNLLEIPFEKLIEVDQTTDKAKDFKMKIDNLNKITTPEKETQDEEQSSTSILPTEEQLTDEETASNSITTKQATKKQANKRGRKKKEEKPATELRRSHRLQKKQVNYEEDEDDDDVEEEPEPQTKKTKPNTEEKKNLNSKINDYIEPVQKSTFASASGSNNSNKIL